MTLRKISFENDAFRFTLRKRQYFETTSEKDTIEEIFNFILFDFDNKLQCLV